MNETQKERIIELSRKVGWVDQIMAWKECGCMRLASRISDIKRDGYYVESRMKEVKNRWGESCYVKEYKITSQEQMKQDIKSVIMKLAEAFTEDKSNDE